MADRAPSRFPARVYATGDEPDARFSLANERTFLAWIRTSLALLVAGVAVQALDPPLPGAIRTAASVVLVVMGILAPVQAWVGWATTERALRSARPLRPPRSGPWVAVGVLSAAVLVLVGLPIR